MHDQELRVCSSTSCFMLWWHGYVSQTGNSIAVSSFYRHVPSPLSCCWHAALSFRQVRADFLLSWTCPTVFHRVRIPQPIESLPAGHSGCFPCVGISNNAESSQSARGFSFPRYCQVALQSGHAGSHPHLAVLRHSPRGPHPLPWFCQTFWFLLIQELLGAFNFHETDWAQAQLRMLNIQISSYRHCLSLSFHIFPLGGLSFSY